MPLCAITQSLAPITLTAEERVHLIGLLTDKCEDSFIAAAAFNLGYWREGQQTAVIRASALYAQESIRHAEKCLSSNPDDVCAAENLKSYTRHLGECMKLLGARTAEAEADRAAAGMHDAPLRTTAELIESGEY